MKSKKIIYLEKILRFMAKAVIFRHRPVIVGITGSVGKTSAKEAIFAVLSSKFKVRKNEKNYNNEIGIPLTIIGTESGKRSVLKWLKVLAKWIFVLVFPVRYPKILVLEMGVDRPGDMEYLLSFVRPAIGIITAVSESHLEFFKNLDHIAREKGKLIKNLPSDGMAIINKDNEKYSLLEKMSSAPVISFGSDADAQIRFSDANFIYNGFEPQGISFKLNYAGKIIPIRLPHILAPHLIYSALAAIAAGIFFKINLVDISKALENFDSPPGRMKLIKVEGGSYIIDDTYNSSPIAAIAALDVLKEIKAFRKISVLGDMLELGKSSETGHKEVANSAFRSGVSLFFAVGNRMKEAFRELEKEQNLFGRVFYFNDPVSAGKEVKKILKKGDLILVKGSQGMRMEKAVEEIISNPDVSEAILCRQSKDWKKKPFVAP